MIDIRTLDIFQKFTGWLASIFFAAAYFYHGGMLDERHLPSAGKIAQYYNHDTLYWLLANEFLPLQIAAWGLFIGGFTWLFAYTLMSFQREILHRIDYRFPGLPYPLFGLVCLGMGILWSLSLLFGIPILSSNFFWSLGLLCYGYYLLALDTKLKVISFS